MLSPAANAGLPKRDWRALLRKADRLASRDWRWLVLIAWLIIAASFLFAYANSIHWLALADTDDNMRFVQVRDWLAGQGWSDLRQHRMDPPRGANIHWSRLVDLPLAGLMLFFRSFLSTGAADRLAAGIAPLLPLLPLMFALAFLARRLSRDEFANPGQEGAGYAWLIAILLPMGARMGFGMYMPLRIDHHGWQLALTAVALAGLVDRKWVRGGIVAGVASAASVAIGMEMMVYLAGAGALIALRWIFKEGAARRLRPYALSLGGTTAIGYAFFASEANQQIVCDALSPVWTSIIVLASGVLLLISMLPLRTWPLRLTAAAIGGLIIAAFAWITFPQCLTGVYQISPELQRSWLAYIREAKPITVQARSSWLPMIAIPATGLVSALVGCWCARRDPERLWAWGTVTLMIAFAIALMFWQIRAAPAAQLLAIPPMAWAMWGLIAIVVRARISAKIAAVLGLAITGSAACAYPLYKPLNGIIVEWLADKPATPPLPKANMTGSPGNDGATATTSPPSASSASTAQPASAGTSATASAAKPGDGRRCRALPALEPLDQLPPSVIFTLVDLGPRIIATTHQSVIAGPYHRNGEDILDIHHAFDGSPERFREIAARHGATYLLTCPGFPEGSIYQRRSPKGFYARLMRGETFGFLEPVTLNFKGTLPYRLYRILPEDQKE